MKGLMMALGALGIKIDPREIEQQYENLRVMVPQFAARAEGTLKSIDTRLADIQARLAVLEAEIGVRPQPGAVAVTYRNGAA